MKNSEQPVKPPLRILHLEDSPRDATLLHDTLQEELTCEVTHASGRVEFEAALRLGEFDLILCDYSVPGYDGLSALRLAKSSKPEVPVIMISGALDETGGVESMKLGATDYLLKQRLERLVPAVRRAIQQAEGSRQQVALEKALAENQRFSRATLDALSAHIAVLDGLGNIVATNQAWRNFANANSTAWQSVTEQMNYLAVCDQAAALGDANAGVAAQVIREVIAGKKESWFYEHPCHSPGEHRWFYRRVTRYDMNGNPRIVIADENISELRKANQKVAASERLLADLFEFAPDAILLTNEEGIIVQASRLVESVFGWKRSELVGQPIEVLMPPETRAGHVGLRQNFLKSLMPRAMGAGRSDLRGMRKDGTIFPVDISLSLTETEEGLLIAAAVRDVSERQVSEKTLHEAKEFAETVVATVSGLFYVLDQAGRYLRWNQSMQDLFGFSSDQMRETYALATVHEQDRDLIAGKMAEIFTSGYAQAEARLLTKDGAQHFLLNGRRLEINGVVYLVGSGADITERKQAEEEVRLLNQTLERRVHDRTIDLSQTNAQLANASQAKSQFLATMSHELRTPLNGILGMNELLLGSELNDRQRRFVEACRSSGKLLMQLINNILDLSKIEAGKLELDARECDLEAVVYDVAEIMSHAARQKALTLNCQLAPHAGVIGMCDDNRLRQVLVNLVGNALKFTSTGGVTITGDRVIPSDGHDRLRFSVVDTGIGIPEERRHRLFEAFSQVDSSTTRRFGGTGLGLSICRQLVELMGGKIGVESQVGVGSTFWFEIPMEIIDDRTGAERKRRLLGGTRIIAVDGLDRERLQVGQCLSNWGCPFEQVATVAGALEAVGRARAAGSPFGIVLADCRLVTGDEYVLLQKLAAMPGLHVIGLGAPPDNITTEYLHSLGVRHVLRDPVRPSALFNAICSTLSVTDGTAADKKPDGTPLSPPAVTIAGRVLVAEDNAINQLYIAELLNHFGCTCDVVVNGEEALAAVQQQHYDLVLMDCQMPEMDGFTASREIRRREAAAGASRQIPIIALTANALKGNRERCLNAGMSDYLSKPIESYQLHEMLQKYLSPAQTPPTSGDAI